MRYSSVSSTLGMQRILHLHLPVLVICPTFGSSQVNNPYRTAARLNKNEIGVARPPPHVGPNPADREKSARYFVAIPNTFDTRDCWSRKEQTLFKAKKIIFAVVCKKNLINTLWYIYSMKYVILNQYEVNIVITWRYVYVWETLFLVNYKWSLNPEAIFAVRWYRKLGKIWALATNNRTSCSLLYMHKHNGRIHTIHTHTRSSRLCGNGTKKIEMKIVCFRFALWYANSHWYHMLTCYPQPTCPPHILHSSMHTTRKLCKTNHWMGNNWSGQYQAGTATATVARSFHQNYRNCPIPKFRTIPSNAQNHNMYIWKWEKRHVATSNL